MCPTPEVELEPVGESSPLVVSKGQAVEQTPVDRRKRFMSPLTLPLAAVVLVVLLIIIMFGSSFKENAGSHVHVRQPNEKAGSHVRVHGPRQDVNIAFLGNRLVLSKTIHTSGYCFS